MGYEEAVRRIDEAAVIGKTELDLSWQELPKLPLELFQLTDLTKLNLNFNRLSYLPPKLFQLTNLTELDLSENRLSSLPPEIVQLTKLNRLYLFSNRLSYLPPKLFQLPNLAELDLGINRLSSLPPEIVQLTNLTRLNLGENQLSSLPPKLFQLTNLTELDFRSNQLTELPPEIIRLTGLTRLTLIDNQLTRLPPKIVQLTKLKTLSLRGNPLISPPYEFAAQGIDAIREYFTSAQAGTQPLAEIKVILVGEGASGKTSLTRCLCGERFNPNEQTTHGIRIKDWQPDTGKQQVRCNLWDFGGQEIMHATHQFFLSRRSLYILVLDGRRDERPEYWLRYIESFGGGSPVLVVLNKYDTNPSFDLNRPFLQEKYPFIVGFWRTSCRTGQYIADLRKALLEELPQVPMINTRWPDRWFRAKESLRRLNEPCISYEKFEAMCIDAGVTEESTRNALTDFLHDLGIVIHFTDFDLEDNHILDPKWVTGAVYKIINAESIAAGKGLLRLKQLKKILRPQKDDPYIYKRSDHRYFIELMKKFEICYDLPSEEVLIPQLLAVPQPSFEFAYEGALRFVLHYADFLPPSIMPRFIVRRHHEIKGELRWRDGVVLENPLLEATAVVKVDNEARRIHIAVSGRERKVYLALLWLSLREINTGFEGLKVSERVPLPNDPSITFDYQTLLTNLEQGVEKFVPEGADKAYSVPALLAAVHPDSQNEGERMLAMAQADKEQGRLRRLAKGLNRYFDVELNLFGVKFDYKTFFDDILTKGER